MIRESHAPCPSSELMNFGFYLPACPDLEDEDDALDKGGVASLSFVRSSGQHVRDSS
jgi:hypothetical protein